MIQVKPIARVVGILLVIIGAMMWTGLLISWFYRSGDGLALLLSGLISAACGAPLWLWGGSGQRGQIRKREGYLIVSMGWVAMSLFGMLPYLISGIIPTIPDALFETVSGISTTGASVLTDIEAVPHGILYWRSLTHWIGGMGIIVLTVAIMPLLGIGGIELFVAESPGPTSDKLHPRISETAKRLWLIYVGLTLALFILLTLAGMTRYDALNHAFATMATGGFSTKNASIAHYTSPLIQYILIVFMFLAGTNFTVLYLTLKGRFRRVAQNEEFRAYLGLTLVLMVLLTLKVQHETSLPLEQAFRDTTFQIVSVITTTGFITADYTRWADSVTMLFFVLLFVGACAGSTAGGIKVVRHLVFFKNSFLEFKRILHPQAIVPLKLNGQIVPGKIITHIIIFLLLYLMVFIISSILLSAMGIDFLTAIGAVATCLSNVGPGIGKVGPVDNFAWLPAGAKVFLSFIMLLGRLELFTILVLFTPYFWKSN